MEGREGQHHRHPSNTRMWWMIVRQRLGGIPGPGSWFRFQPLQVRAMDKDSNTATLHCNSSIVIKKKQSKVDTGMSCQCSYYEETKQGVIECERSIITMILLWLNNLVHSLGNCTMTLLTDTDLSVI